MPPKQSSASSAEPPRFTHWLLKAEPDSRVEKGVDVKFSVDDFEKCRVTAWEGVRNHQAKNYLRHQMKVGHECLFYASNCKVPGVTALAKVSREGYPDHNAWDPNHPYYDPKSSSDSPTWYMIDLSFVSRLPHMVPLKLLQTLGQTSYSSLPDSVKAYLTEAQLGAIRLSALLARGRLSVQGCEDGFYEAVKSLGEKGGWEDWFEEMKGGGKVKTKAGAKRAKEEDQDQEAESGKSNKGTKKAKVVEEKTAVKKEESGGARRSTRSKK